MTQAIPAILRREDVVIAAETGGGKTLAYLLPLLEQLHGHPLAMKDVHRPVGLILTTSQELVRQIASVLAALHPEIAKHTVSLSSTNQSLSNHRTCPLVIATPKALLRACKPKDFAFTRSIVVDEADMLLGGGFERDTKQILATIRNQPLLLESLNDWERARARSGKARATIADSDGTADDGDDDDDEEVIDKSEVSQEQRQTIFSAISFSHLLYVCICRLCSSSEQASCWCPPLCPSLTHVVTVYCLCGFFYATIPDYGKRSVRQFIEYKFPNAHFAVTQVRL